MSDSTFIRHEPCPQCGSKDNLSRWSDGHGFCHGCLYYEPGEGETTTARRERRVSDLIPPGEFLPLKKRGISQETCAKYGYSVGSYQGRPCHIEPHYDEHGHLVAQHLRFPDKTFIWLGDANKAMPYGWHVWKDGGRRLIITEGAIDLLSVSQLQGNKWPVWSISCGAGTTPNKLAKYMAKFSKWLEKFDEVIICFDQDEPGQISAKAAASVMSPGKARIVTMPLKDANDMLVAGRGEELLNCIWQAKEYRPDGLLRASDIIERALAAPQMGAPFPWATLTDLTYGRQPGRVYTWGGATGGGKTDILLQIYADRIMAGEQVGLFLFENSVEETMRYLAAKIDGALYTHPEAGWTQEALEERLKWLVETDRVGIYDNWGSCDWDEVRGHIRYLANYCGATSVLIDHLSALSSAEEDERQGLEKIMPQIAMLTKELGIVTDVVSHLSTPDGKPHEEGGRVMIRHFRGSRTIGYWSHVIFGLERNQQAEDEEERQTTYLRILKCRPRGSSTGRVVPLRYNPRSGLVREVEVNPFETEEADEECPF